VLWAAASGVHWRHWMTLAAHRCAVGYRRHVEHLKQPPTLEGDREGVM